MIPLKPVLSFFCIFCYNGAMIRTEAAYPQGGCCMYRILEWNPQLHPYVGAIEHRMQDRVRFSVLVRKVLISQ